MLHLEVFGHDVRQRHLQGTPEAFEFVRADSKAEREKEFNKVVAGMHEFESLVYANALSRTRVVHVLLGTALNNVFAKRRYIKGKGSSHEPHYTSALIALSIMSPTLSIASMY